MKPHNQKQRAFSLLELTFATAILATVMASVVVVVRTSHAAWELHERDAARLANVHALLRHIVREVRQADSVTAITAPSNAAGSLSILTASGETQTWTRLNNDAVTLTRSDSGGADDIAEFITALTFTGYEADGVTQTTDPDAVQVVECRASTELQHDVVETRTVSSRVLIRSW